MTTSEILIGIILGLLVNECCEVSPWLARNLVRWSARRRYANPRRAEIRAEELVGLIDARPGKLFKLVTALGFVITATAIFLGRCVADRTPDKLKRSIRATVTSSVRPAAPMFYEVVTAIEDIPCMRDEHTRSLVIEQLSYQGAIRYFTARRAHLISILRTSVDFEDGLVELVRVISNQEPKGSIPLKRLRALLTGGTR
jgi:hypothetical protein